MIVCIFIKRDNRNESLDGICKQGDVLNLRL